MWFGARVITYVVNSTKTQNIENVTCDNIQLKGNSGIVWSEIHLAELETTTWEPGGVMSCWFACCHSEHDLINTYWLKDQVVSSLKCIWHFPVIEHAVSWVYGPRITKHEAVTRGREKRSLRAHLNVDIYRLALLAAEAGTRQHIAQLMFWRQASKLLQ